MAIADRMSGADLTVYFIHSGGTADLSGDYRTLSVTREQETADATAGADGARVYIATIQNFSASLEAMYLGTAGTATMGSVALGATGTLQYFPKGTATGNPKGAIPVIVTSSSLDITYDDVVTVSFEFQGQGAEVWNPLKDVV